MILTTLFSLRIIPIFIYCIVMMILFSSPVLTVFFYDENVLVSTEKYRTRRMRRKNRIKRKKTKDSSL